MSRIFGRHHLSALVIAVAIFAAGSAYSYPSICCMFGASRHFGWPYPYVSLHKTVETYAEAEMVRTSGASELLRAGWKFSFSPDVETSGVVSSPFLGLLADLALAVVCGLLIESAFLAGWRVWKNRRAGR